MTYNNPHGPSCPWFSFAESSGSPNIKWCEETLCQWISEPANTWSNLGYMIVGLLITYLSVKNKHSFKITQFGPIVFFMGAMSFVYHLSNIYLTQILDFVGMFLFVGWVIGINLIRLKKIKSNQLLGFNLGLTLFYSGVMHLMYVNEIKFQMLILISAVIIVITEFLAKKHLKINYTWFFVSLAMLCSAFSFSISDHTGYWCHPTEHGWFSQGHAVWHWLGSIAMFAIYKHYSQEALKPQENA
jgi:Ceramidase